MKKKFLFPTLAIIALIIFAFSQKQTSQQSKKIVLQKDGITLSEAENFYDFPNATLKMNSPANSSNLDTGKTKFSYTVENYQLGNQTPDADMKLCANSAKGQHIHLILNNEPYSAWYTPDFEVNLNPGHYVALSFLSRSYHESIKTKKAYTLTQFTVGKPIGLDTVDCQTQTPLKWDQTFFARFQDGKSYPYHVDLTEPMLFYSRPKGTYVGGKEIKKLLLDFYLVNTDLSENGNKVKATINGTEFILTKWVPYFIEGLPMGKNKIKLELINNEGKPIYGHYKTSGERTFELAEDEPIKK